MPKKDTATAVLGMLSTAGAQTRAPLSEPPAPEVTPPPAPEPMSPRGGPPAAPQPAAASVSTLPSSAKRRCAADEPPRARCVFGRIPLHGCAPRGWKPSATTSC